MIFVLLVILALLVLFAIWFVVTRNSFVKADNQWKEAFSTMDVYLKRRSDLVPNLVNTVKGFAAHESDVLIGVVQARNAVEAQVGNPDPTARLQSENALTAGLGRIFALAESYPELQSNTNFLNLQEQLGQIETDIAASRKYYNATVRYFNNKAQMFPTSLVASMAGFHEKPFFEVTNEERQNVNVQF